MAKKPVLADEAVVVETTTEVVDAGQAVAADTPAEPVIAEVLKKAAEKAAAEAQAKADKKAAAEAAKAEKKAKAEAAKAEREAAKAAKKAEKQSQPSQNGVTRPRPGSACALIWNICDAVSKEMKQPAPVSAVIDVCAATKHGDEDLNTTTVRCQYARWRKFHGIVGRVAAPSPVDAGAVSEAVVAESAEQVLPETISDEVAEVL